MKTYCSEACSITAALVLLMFGPTVSSIASAQGRPFEPVVPLPDMNAAAIPLLPEELAAFPRSTAVRSEDVAATGLGSVKAPEPLDPYSRVALHTQAGTLATVFTVSYLGDANANDINRGDGICADFFGTCGLRTAIQEANALPGLDTILLPEGVILLATAGANEDAAVSGDLDITDSLVIRGAGASLSFINGNGSVMADRVFHVLQSAGSYVTADFVDLSIQGGNLGSGAGGGVSAGCRADVVVLRSSIFDNFGLMGGGLSVHGTGCTAATLPRMVVYGSAIYRNVANSNLAGAGVDLFAGGTLNVINSTVALNVNNSAMSTAAGGISISSNTSNNATLRSSTIIDNSAPNAPANDGVGIRIGAASTATLIDNLIGFNTFSNGNSSAHCGGSGTSITSGGGNIYSIGTVTCPVNANDSTGNGSALVGSLAPNAPGQTQTAAVSSLSAARAFGKSCILPQDQRGVERPLRACTSGAFQYVDAPRPPEIFDNGFE
jgi:hypothetical protein